MKILQINSNYGIGSTGKNLEEIQIWMENNNHEIYIACSSECDSNKDCYGIETPTGKKIHWIKSILLGKQAFFSKKATIKLIRYIQKVSPDIIHLNNLHDNYINFKLLGEYLIKEQIPTVLTLHDCWFYTGKCCHYVSSKCYKWKTECYNCPRVRKDNKSLFLDRANIMHKTKKYIFENMEFLAVIGVSDWITSEAKESILKNAKIIRRIYNWIDTDIFKPINTNLKERLNLNEFKILLGISSYWTKEKGIFDFIKIAEKMPDNYRIVLIGKIKINEKLPNKIIVVDEIQDSHVLNEFYNMADVFLNLSVEESFGKVTAESLAAGTPVITYDQTASPEIICEECGFSVETSNIDQVIDKMKELIKNGKKRYSLNCTKHATTNFNKNTNIKEYEKIYNELMLLKKGEDR